MFIRDRKEVQITGSLDVTAYSSVDDTSVSKKSAVSICRNVGTYQT
jgi:hypothetical protein